MKKSAAVLIGGVLALSSVGCGSGSTTEPGGKVQININGQPPQTQAFDRKVFDEDVAEFETANPDIDLVPHEGFMDPKTFSAKLAGGQLEDVFYVYFTDPAALIARKQAADLTDYVKDVPHYGDLKQELKDVFTVGGKVYGLPTANYTMGLLYSRANFTKAGLDPDSPPKTWDEVRSAAKKLKDAGVTGFAEYSKSNQGGWHFTTWMKSVGGDVARKDGDTYKADFNNDKGKEVLRRLKEMRWDDNSMGEKQLLEIGDVQNMMGAGQLGMYLAAPDNVAAIVNQFKGKYDDYGLAAIPEQKGTLLGGEGYMINPKATPEKIKAGLKWIQWKYLNPDRLEGNLQKYKDRGQPVGLPIPPIADIWTGEPRKKQEELKAKYATMPVKNFQAYVDGSEKTKGSLEPPQAQQVYAILDSVVQATLTNSDADHSALLKDAETKVNAVLAQVK
ncbi:ABC transporter substrate-binding protein [Lentzea flaviverrucosa]|uniref:ABC-type glycerol-3-phosphate transport system, substrate-binding protein n=1 Tax=Lentzea flaviverrucosa TaxID=200379 RepID=A0A1H9VNM4_9PSEU|nr:extracellular solute-binding protein [Lentzea flaviverrucosa]RDI23735.1 ABC-type glycerol-3-phosphate transport system substrate-binding protein [Lentzea flaviverrucosa]SES23159.1 ABC-type glycerol-3-phosphate transport system, substrate-binding protein [Lentzea flaviverrucosa]